MVMEAREVSMQERILQTVRAELLRVCQERQPGFDAEIALCSSLVADLGLDSLSLVEAVVAIEQALRIDPLPLDALGECEAGREGERFTVDALVKLCMKRVSASAVGASA